MGSIKKAEEELKAQGNKSPKKKIAIKRDVPIPAPVVTEEEPKKTPEIKIEKNEPLELKNTKMKAENKINEVPEIKNEKDSKKEKNNEIPKMKKGIKIIIAKNTEQENYKEKDDLNKEEVEPKDQNNEQLKNLQNLMSAKLEREPP